VIALTLNAGVPGGQSIVSVADAEIDRLYDAIVTVPQPPEYIGRRREHTQRPRWQRAFVIAIIAIPVVAYVAVFAVYLVDLLTHNFVPEGNYFVLINTTIQGLVWAVVSYALTAFERRVKLRQRQKAALTIFPSGIALDGQFVSWTDIGSCRWNRYLPAALVIAVDAGHSHWQHTVSVPESHRALVEKTIRGFGKWDEPRTVEEVAPDTGMSINLTYR
jgi:hypothetical protein